MPASTLPADLAGSEEFSLTLLEVALAGFILFRPVYDGAGATITDLAYEYLNPAAQQMLRLPQRPAESFLTLFPMAAPVGIFAFYRDAFLSGQTQREAFNYQHDGLDSYFHLVARRQGALLLVSFTDINNQPRTAVEEALRQSRAREQTARQEAERERNLLQAMLTQAPVAIGLFQGEECVVSAANDLLCAMWGHAPAQVLGRPLLEGVPELRGQGFTELMQQVARTRVPFVGTEAPAQLRQPDGSVQTHYFNFVYQPLYAPDGSVLGVVDIAVDVTEQVRVRQQVQQLNEELEMRVTARSAETRAALFEAEDQRERLHEQQRLLGQILRQVPAAIATLSGPEHRFSFFNEPYQVISAGRSVLGRTVGEVFPELVEQGIISLLDRVYTTGEPFIGTEILLMLQDAATGQVVPRYIDFTYQPLLDGQQRPHGVLIFALDVTEQVRTRKQADTLQTAMLAVAQRQAQQRQDLFQIFEQTPVAIVLLREPDHRIDYFNPAFTELFPPEDWAGPLPGHTLAEVYPRIKLAGLVELMDEVFRTGESQAVIDMPLEKLHPGSPRYVTFAYQAYREEGRIVGIAAFIYDVTEQVLARRGTETLQAELLAASRQQVQERDTFYQIFEQAPALIQLLRAPCHRIEYVNEAYQRLFPGRQLVGLDLADALPELREQGFIAFMDRVYQTGETYYGQDLLFTVPAHGDEPARSAYFTFTYKAYRENGQIAGISVFAFEVTEQVRARQQREAQRQELQRIFEQAPVAITIMRGRQLVVELANASILRIWGRPAAQVLGRPYFEAVPDTAGQGFEAVLDGVLTTGQPYTITEAPVQLDRAHTGQPTLGYVNFVFQPLYDEQQAVSGLIAIGTEVTAQVQVRQQVQALNGELAAINREMLATNAELKEANTRLARTNADLDTFVYSASHDLKSPITNIEGLLNALREHLPAPAVQHPLVPRLLDMMDGAVGRFQQTLGHLTDVTRLEEALLTQPAEAIDLPALVEAVRLDILPELTAAGATLVVNLAACPAFRFPVKNLRSIVYNLLSNAIKYRAPDRPPRVELRCDAAADRVLLTVQDNGLGLTEAQQGELFRMFRRLHSHVPGSGVGLYMVKKMAENVGGTITVQSQPGVGSTFTVALPLRA